MFCTVLSAWPFDWGKLRLYVRCLNSQLSAKALDSALAYCGPLSDMTMSAIPRLAKIYFIALMTPQLVVKGSFYITGYCGKWSANSRYSDPLWWKRSVPIFSHGLSGNECMSSGSFMFHVFQRSFQASIERLLLWLCTCLFPGVTHVFCLAFLSCFGTMSLSVLNYSPSE